MYVVDTGQAIMAQNERAACYQNHAMKMTRKVSELLQAYGMIGQRIFHIMLQVFLKIFIKYLNKQVKTGGLKYQVYCES